MTGFWTPEMILVLMLAFLHLALSVILRPRLLPRWAILNRWLRWILFSMVAALLMRSLGWTERPIWAIAFIAFLLWFLGETIYNWIAITAISRSDIPLFPRFRINQDGDDWPAEASHVQLREWLRQNGFRRRQSLKATLFDEIEIRSSIYDREDGLVRLQVLFIPQSSGRTAACYLFSTRTTEQERLITDNIFIPFGGFYPAEWRLVRKPLLRNPRTLYRLHERRIRRLAAPALSWNEDGEPVDDLNRQQHQLEKINTDLGFLLPPNLREEHGKFSQTGRYRVWKEVWLLSYFGTTVHHR